MRTFHNLLKIVSIFLLINFTTIFTAQAVELESVSPEEQIAMRYVSEYSIKSLSTQTALRIAQTAYRYAKEARVDPMLVLAIMRQESGFNPIAKSSEGARGLMQVLPRAHRVELKGKNVVNIDTNIELGIQIYSNCLKARGSVHKALNCYSGGAGKKYSNSVVAYMHHAQHYVIEQLFGSDDLQLASR